MFPFVRAYSYCLYLIFLPLFFACREEKLTPAGTNLVDASFRLREDIGYDKIIAMAFQQDGKVIIGGDFDEYGNNGLDYLVRLNADGTTDKTFRTARLTFGNGFTNLNSIAVQPDGKILVAGRIYQYDDKTVNNLMRLHADGKLDTSFHPIPFNGEITKVVLYKSGKILVGGSFSYWIAGTTYENIIRLNPSGSFDAGFPEPTSGSVQVKDITLDAQERVMVGGYTYYLNGKSYFNLIRLNANLTLDESFLVNGGVGTADNIEKVIALPDKRILAVGGGSSLFGKSRIYGFCILSEDGLIDNDFAYPTKYNSTINDCVVLPSGLVLVAGSSLKFEFDETNRTIADFDLTGKFKSKFKDGDFTNNGIEKIFVAPDGKIYLTGNFTTVAGFSYKRLVRLNAL